MKKVMMALCYCRYLAGLHAGTVPLTEAAASALRRGGSRKKRNAAYRATGH